jgi:hypothetical protein
LGSQVAPEAVLFVEGSSVHHVVAFIQLGQKRRQLVRRMLQVVIHCCHNFVASFANAAQQGIVLAIVAQQVEASNERVLPGQRADPLPAFIAAAIVN